MEHIRLTPSGRGLRVLILVLWNTNGTKIYPMYYIFSVLILVLMEYKWNLEAEHFSSNWGFVLILVLMEYKWNQCSRAQGFEWFEGLKV